MVNNTQTLSSLIWQIARVGRLFEMGEIVEPGNKRRSTPLARTHPSPPEAQTDTALTSTLPSTGFVLCREESL